MNGKLALRIFLVIFVGMSLGHGSLLLAQSGASDESAPQRRIVISSVKPAMQRSVVLHYGLTRQDVRRIEALESVKTCTPVRVARFSVSVGERIGSVVVTGTTPQYALLHSLRLEPGRFLAEKDIEFLNNVAVLSEPAARFYFPGQNPVGENVRIGRSYYLVVGTVKTGGDRRIYIPLSTMRSRMGDLTLVREAGNGTIERYEISRVELDVPRPDADQTAAQIEQLLRRSHTPGEYRVEIEMAETR